MRKIDGVADVRAERLTGLPQLRVQVDRSAAARVGLTPGDVIEAIEVGLAGKVVSEVWVGQRRFDLVIRLAEDHRRDAASLAALLIDGHDGTRIRNHRADVRPRDDQARSRQPTHRRGGERRGARSGLDRV